MGFYELFEAMCKKKCTHPCAVANRAGFGRSTCTNWKVRGNVPKFESLEKLAAVLGCSPYELMPEGVPIEYPDPEPEPVGQAFECSSTEQELVSMFRTLSAVQQAAVVGLLNAFAGGSK